MNSHVVAQMLIGWLKKHNRNKFEIYSYALNEAKDFKTQEFIIYSDVFHQIPNDLEAVCQQIVNDQLHVLVFLDIGMYAMMTQIAGLRLAPVQCTTWGHPITSGLPTIDYFLSCELMEPENGEEHYSEQLIKLPNIGLYYEKPFIPETRLERDHFKLRADAVVYLSCQSLYKYLPQYDYVFAAIAHSVPSAQFAFIGSNISAAITEKFRRRLRSAFASYGLNSEDYCAILPRLNGVEYSHLNLVSDIYLDTFSWSGGNTTMTAIACGLPIVTCPGEFMRGRHSYGILKMLGVTDTIAKNEAEYIEIAVRLGWDRGWRQTIANQVKQNQHRVFEDNTCVVALEEFYQRVVNQYL